MFFALFMGFFFPVGNTKFYFFFPWGTPHSTLPGGTVSVQHYEISLYLVRCLQFFRPLVNVLSRKETVLFFPFIYLLVV